MLFIPRSNIYQDTGVAAFFCTTPPFKRSILVTADGRIFSRIELVYLLNIFESTIELTTKIGTNDVAVNRGLILESTKLNLTIVPT